MRITIIQPDIVWADPAANRKKLNDLILPLEDTGLVVLPEMFSTGFVTEPEGTAEQSGESLHWMKELSKIKGFAIAGSIAEKSEEKYFNRFHFVMPDSTDTTYDKHHLFTYSGEHLKFTGGQKRTVVQWQGMRFLLQICYDLRFPVFSRNTMHGGIPEYDAIIYAASWPEKRSAAWKALLKARAIENQCFVIGVNRVGNDPGNVYSGDSVILAPDGSTIACAEPYRESVISGELDPELLMRMREGFPVLEDADRFSLEKGNIR